MTPHQKKVITNALKRINELTRERVLHSIKGRVDTCLPSCMVLSEILKAARYEHKLVPVICEVRNNLKGDDYWGVGIDRHLVVTVANQFMLDPSLDQASRPQHQMKLEPLVYASPHVEWLISQGMKLEQNGCSVNYKPMAPWHLNAPDYVTPAVWEMATVDAVWVLERLKAEGVVILTKDDMK